MKLDINRDGIDIIPETIQDEIYVESVLGLTQDGDSIPLRRVGIQHDGETLLKLEARRA